MKAKMGEMRVETSQTQETLSLSTTISTFGRRPNQCGTLKWHGRRLSPLIDPLRVCGTSYIIRVCNCFWMGGSPSWCQGMKRGTRMLEPRSRSRREGLSTPQPRAGSKRGQKATAKETRGAARSRRREE